MASHEHNLLPFSTPQSYPLLSAESKAVSAANNKGRLGECHDILFCRTILTTHRYFLQSNHDLGGLRKGRLEIGKPAPMYGDQRHPILQNRVR